MITNLLLMAAELVAFAALALLLHSLTRRYGLAPLFAVLVGSVAVLHAAGPVASYIQPGPGFILVFGSTVVVPVVLMGLLVIYVVNGTAAARLAIGAILGVSLLAVILQYVQGLHAGLPGGGTLGMGLDRALAVGSLAITVSSLFAFATSLSIVVISYQAMTNHARQIPGWLVLGIALIAGSWADAIVIRLLASPWFDFRAPLDSALLGKTGAALLLWPMAAAYLRRGVPHTGSDTPSSPRKTFDLLLGSYGRQAARLMQTEAARQRSESQYRALVEQGSDGVVIADSEGRIIEVNSHARTMLNYAIDDVPALSLEELFFAVDPRSPPTRFWDLRLGKRMAGEFRLKRGNATLLPVQVNGEVLPDGRLMLKVRDISQRMRAENALRETQARLSLVIANTPIVFFAVDRNGVFTLSEGAGLKALGLQPGEVVGQSVYDLYPTVGPYIRRAMGGEPCSDSIEIDDLAWETFYFPVHNLEGEVDGVAGVATDVTERMRAGRALRESEERFRGTFEQAAVGLAHVAPDGSFVMVNRKLCDILGYTEAELRTMSFQAITHPDDGTRDLAQIQRLLNGRNHEHSAETRYIHKDGSIVWAQLTMALLRSDTGEPKYFISVVEDITERKLTQDQLRQAQKMEVVGQLTGGVAHDFNNLLTVIMGGLEMASHELRQPGKTRAVLEMALAASRKGAALTQHLLAFSRKQALQPVTIDLGFLLSEMKELLVRTLGETVEIDVRLEEGVWECVADRSQMENVVLNLALNARDAMSEGGMLTLKATNAVLSPHYAASHDIEPGEYVLLSVADSGTGMCPDMVERAFEPFFTTKGVGKGSGLGLSMVYGFVKQSGGHVNIDSRPGRGTAVRIYLPRARKSVARRRDISRPVSEPRGRGETILVVEDDPTVRGLLVDLLADLGYAPLEAGDGPSALTLLQELPEVALLFTDVVLPGGMTGVRLAQEAQRRRPGLRVVYTSGYSEDTLVHDGRLEDGCDMLEKPLHRAELASFLHTVLRRNSVGKMSSSWN